jgi:multiple sugar transport system ATP-binding protein
VLSLKDVSKRYPNGFTAVKNLNLDVKAGEFVALIGPVGSGKSTVLRMIAGLENITSGELRIDGDIMNGVSRKNRNIAIISQKNGLYPRMSVQENIAAPTKALARAAAEAAGVEELLSVRVKSLSLAQKLRVAIAREISKNPGIILFDEPLANLTPGMKERARIDISVLRRGLGATFIYAARDQEEAMALADKLVIMRNGAITASGTPSGLYRDPPSLFVADFIGTPRMNMLEAVVLRKKDDVFLATGNGMLIPVSDESLKKDAGLEVIVGVRPERAGVASVETAPPRFYVHEFEIAAAELFGANAFLRLRLNDDFFSVLGTPSEMPKPGEKVKIAIDTENIYLFNRNTEEAIPYRKM